MILSILLFLSTLARLSPVAARSYFTPDHVVIQYTDIANIYPDSVGRYQDTALVYMEYEDDDEYFRLWGTYTFSPPLHGLGNIRIKFAREDTNCYLNRDYDVELRIGAPLDLGYSESRLVQSISCYNYVEGNPFD